MEEINVDSKEWDEAMDWAYQRAREEGDVDLDYDEEIIFAWAEEYYYYLKGGTSRA